MLVCAGELVAERFEIERLIGSGGMGSVFRAKDRAAQGFAAIKVVRSPDANVAERFAREARVLEQLSHPTIVGYVSHGKMPDGSLFLAMEWLEGEDLGARLDAGKLAVADAVACMNQIAVALGVAHARNVVHRDIKPSNIFLVERRPDRAKLLDFGVAHLAELDALTKTGSLVGTPLYMAPEQVTGRGMDARTDVFALGAVLFHCLTGRPPFPAQNLPELVGKLVSDDPAPRVRTFRPEVSPALDELVAQMLAKNPAQRPANGDAVAAALEARGIGDLGAFATADTGIVPAPTGARAADHLERGHAASREARWPEARAAFEAALAIEDSWHARLGLAKVLCWQNEMVGSVEHFERAYALATKSDAPDAKMASGMIALSLAMHHKKTFANASVARGWLARGTRIVGTPEHPLYSFLLMVQGATADDATEAVALLTRALDAARRTNNRDFELNCLALLGGHRVLGGDLGGMALIEEAMAATMAGEYHNLQTVVGVACSMVTACDAAGDLPRLVEWCGVAEKFSDRFSCPYLYADCRWHYGSGLVATGDWEGGERELELAMHAAPVSTTYHTGAVARLADLRVRQGRIAEAEQLLASVGDKPITRAVAGAIKFAKGEHASATALLQRYIDANAINVLNVASALELLVEVCIARGDHEVAKFAARRLDELAANRHKTIRAHAEAAAGRLALAEGKPTEARTHLERAIDLFSEHNLPHESARARFVLARALAPEHAELARDEARAASTVFTRLGATHDATRAAELLRTLET